MPSSACKKKTKIRMRPAPSLTSPSACGVLTCCATDVPVPRLIVVVMITRPPLSSLFPYTTLFRSLLGRDQLERGMLDAVPSDDLRTRLELLAPRAVQPFVLRLEQIRSEEHTSELQSHSDLVCRLLLAKKKRRSGCARRPRSPHRLHAASSPAAPLTCLSRV